MYEVLSLSMEIENYPKDQVERVLLSMTDFGAVNFENMMYSAKYLARFERKSGAIRLFEQASRMVPEHHEPYVWGLKLVKEDGTNEQLKWAACGILKHYWSANRETLHNQAEDAVWNRIRKLKATGNEEEIQKLTTAMKEAKQRDVIVRVEWNGDADVDLSIEEPPGTICSFETQQTYAGGIHLHDGIGPEQTQCYEEYVCPMGATGTYRVEVKNSFGKLVGNRVTATVHTNVGSPEEKKFSRTLIVEESTAGFSFELAKGRRQQPRKLALLNIRPQRQLPVVNRKIQRVRHVQLNQQRAEVLAEFAQDQGLAPRNAGAIGFAPVVETLMDGARLDAAAVISADRRYVRMTLAPRFSTITDVFTFSLPGGNVTRSPISPAAQGNNGQ